LSRLLDPPNYSGAPIRAGDLQHQIVAAKTSAKRNPDRHLL
jgi:hypothetical protein